MARRVCAGGLLSQLAAPGLGGSGVAASTAAQDGGPLWRAGAATAAAAALVPPTQPLLPHSRRSRHACPRPACTRTYAGPAAQQEQEPNRSHTRAASPAPTLPRNSASRSALKDAISRSASSLACFRRSPLAARNKGGGRERAREGQAGQVDAGGAGGDNSEAAACSVHPTAGPADQQNPQPEPSCNASSSAPAAAAAAAAHPCGPWPRWPAPPAPPPAAAGCRPGPPAPPWRVCCLLTAVCCLWGPVGARGSGREAGSGRA